MDRLNTALAEKVLEISNTDNDDIKAKLQRINRFRDFIRACQSLIKKYPDIEAELLLMIQDNDFDTRIASSRVNTIIRLSDNRSITNPKVDVKEDIHELENIIENLPIQTQPIKVLTQKEFVNTEKSAITTENINDNCTSENNVVKDLPKVEPVDGEKKQQYVDFEEIPNSDLTDVNNIVNYTKENPTISINDRKDKNQNQNSTTKRVLWILAVLASILALWVVVKFVINHWTTIIWILGVCAVLALLFWYLFKRKK